MVYISHMMIRTQIYLPKALYQTIGLIALRRKKPKAAIIRDALETTIARKQGNAGTALLRLAKNPIKGLSADLSTNIDKYLYEE